MLQSAVFVTPFVGVWIETRKSRIFALEKGVTPFVGVWIETHGTNQNRTICRSHPSWVCGLKLILLALIIVMIKSHPSWVCGLKLIGGVLIAYDCQSHPSWVCGLKL